MVWCIRGRLGKHVGCLKPWYGTSVFTVISASWLPCHRPLPADPSIFFSVFFVSSISACMLVRVRGA
jgi:hypothetical protein